MVNEEDIWTIVHGRDWPPPRHPRPPISPSMHENLRECRLRVSFQSSGAEQYPRRTPPVARIGTAFHQTLNQLAHLRSNMGQMDLEAFCQSSVRIFREQLVIQRTESSQEPRERCLQWSDNRLSKVEEAVLVHAREVWLYSQHHTYHPESSTSARALEIDRRLESHDGLLVGIVDRVDLRGGYCRIIDYKTSLNKAEEPHARQIKLYAYLWFDRRGTWPDDGLLVYPLLREEVPVTIDPADCTKLANEVRQEAQLINETLSPDRLGNPGPGCTHCEFRPWCRPFWRSQATSTNDYEQIKRALTGFEAVVLSAQASTGVLFVELEAIDRVVEIRLPLSQFPHLADIQPNDRLRVIDTRLIGVIGRPTADVTEWTEIYRVRNRNKSARKEVSR